MRQVCRQMTSAAVSCSLLLLLLRLRCPDRVEYSSGKMYVPARRTQRVRTYTCLCVLYFAVPLLTVEACFVPMQLQDRFQTRGIPLSKEEEEVEEEGVSHRRGHSFCKQAIIPTFILIGYGHLVNLLSKPNYVHHGCSSLGLCPNSELRMRVA